MTDSAQNRSFRDFVASLWPMADDRGVSRATFDRALEGVVFDPQIVANTTTQAEFVAPIWQYLHAALSPARIARGREKAVAEQVWLDKAKAIYGVDGSVILGIWGLETDFGGDLGSNDVVRSLASLAYVHFRGDYFRDELIAALVVLEQGAIARGDMLGSWAGAIGQTQFMPSSLLIYAVDFERGGRPDVLRSAPDALGSTANFLFSHGWTKGLPWGFEVGLPPAFSLTSADSANLTPFESFSARGVRRADGGPLPPQGRGRLLLPAGAKGPAFLVTPNFDVIKTYNNSTSYALAAALLGDAIVEGRGLAARWPTNDPPLRETQVRRVQGKLKEMGYDAGEIDGMVGETLRAAVRAYQDRRGIVPDGYVDGPLMKRIEAESVSVSRRK
jgi:membrane-bound lytic murein transglycosylase B